VYLGSGFCVAVFVAFFARGFFVCAIVSPVLLGKAPAPGLAFGEHVGLGFDVAGGGQKVAHGQSDELRRYLRDDRVANHLHSHASAMRFSSASPQSPMPALSAWQTTRTFPLT
jgi:hypothetical protein